MRSCLNSALHVLLTFPRLVVARANEFKFNNVLTNFLISFVAVQPKFVIYKHAELAQRQQETVQQTADLLCVSQNEAARVLRFYKWYAEVS